MERKTKIATVLSVLSAFVGSAPDIYGLFRIRNIQNSVRWHQHAKYVMAALLFLAADYTSPASASSHGGGIVTLVATGSDGTTSFQHSGARTGTVPPCATDPSWIFANNTMTGQAILSTLLSAAIAGKNLTVVGSGGGLGDARTGEL